MASRASSNRAKWFALICLTAATVVIGGCMQKQSVQMSTETPPRPLPDQESIEEFPKADPRLTAARELTRRGRDYLDSGDPDSAIRTLERAVNLSPYSPQNYYYLAEAWILKEDFQQAAEYNRLAETYLEQSPDWAERVARQRDRIDELPNADSKH